MTSYQFNLPHELIAQEPAHPRDHARLLVYRLNDGSIIDDYFYNLNRYLSAETTLVINNSKVDNCRWLFDVTPPTLAHSGRKPATSVLNVPKVHLRSDAQLSSRTAQSVSGVKAAIEIFVIEKNDPVTIRAMVRPGRTFKHGSKVQLTDWLEAKVLAIDKEGIRTLRLNVQHDDKRLEAYEHIPLPPYIAQNDALAPEYQTVYAKPPGSLAAPTAGLHFTDELLDKIKKSHQLTEITLHVGLGTFAKLTEENLASGKLHEEYYEIPQEVAEVLSRAKHRTAVGTTTVRTLETFARGPSSRKNSGVTDIFIRPGYHFKAVDSMITNFHLPSTNLLMLVAAFIADKKSLDETEAAAELMRIYQYAITQKYRFYSFGDAMLLV
jgi:S-adenosylmethionine:tRNA ribosyltransferase-isomerase